MVFSTEDPNINIRLDSLEKQENNIFYAELEMIRIPAHIAKSMEAGAQKYIRF